MKPRNNPPPCHWGWIPSVRSALIAVALAAGLVLWLLGERTRGEKPFTPELSVDPNTAPASVLLALPQVGPSRATAILRARTRYVLRSPQDLEREIPGIGPKTAAALVPYMRFPTDVADSRAGP